LIDKGYNTDGRAGLPFRPATAKFSSRIEKARNADTLTPQF
jgi:hypothetical protein